MEKIFKPVDKQLEILEGRDLKLDLSKNQAKEILIMTNYYNLINGYSDPFLLSSDSYSSCTNLIDENTEENYIKGTKFSEIYSLYNFDKSISTLFLKYILIIENRMKSTVAYYFSKKHGHKSEAYLNIENFNRRIEASEKMKKSFDYVVNYRIKKNILYSENKQPYIKHYYDNHGYVPLWVLVNSLSFGDISTFYSLLENDTKDNISNKFSKKQDMNPGLLHNYLKTLAKYRNILAHDERFYKYQQLNKNMRNIKINFRDFLGFSEVDSSVFAVMIIFKTLLEDKEFEEFIESFVTYVYKLRSNLSTISINFILEEMNIILE